MALLADGSISTIAELAAHDSSVLETARGEGIDLSKKIEVAGEAIKLEIAAFLLRNRAGVLTGEGAVDISGVVVTPGMKRWHALRTLGEVYSDAYNSQFNERYQGKWKHFWRLAKEASDVLFETGVGVVGDPLPRPGKPTLAVGAGTGPENAYVIQVAWRNAAGQSSAASEPASFDASGGQVPRVQATGAAPAWAAGFDVYVAVAGESPRRQNAMPVAVGSSWTMPGGGPVDGPEPGNGQSPAYYVRRRRTI